MTRQLTWLVTGCSSGIGEAFVRAILDKGDRVIATARPNKGVSGVDRLASLKEAGAATIELDVLTPQEELNAKAKEAWAIYGQVDVLVNNAGYIEAGIFEELDQPQRKKTMINSLRANVLGPLNFTRAFLPLMRTAKTGTLLFVGSLGIYYGALGANCYIGSKGLKEGLVPNLAVEVASFGIRTSILTFGNFRTEVMSPENMKFGATNPQPEYEELNNLIKLGLSAQNKNQPGDPRKACELVIEAVRGEGRCAGNELPLRLPVGPDALACIRASCTEKLALCDEWDAISSQTDLTIRPEMSFHVQNAGGIFSIKPRNVNYVLS
ncbi:hypothetical protein N7520_005705 [Penicillium odoratum]|uniref:uncharacterized protein n=1 Tax=Penicillium odoratum TaxID=1167516 RepID=UPI002548E2F6|nr:uncharacterized protein N7520_005705 [Penicillium odoratum]KAJ5758549.1 hypothetical protein N7520_005705 [Penicillium odoratum]